VQLLYLNQDELELSPRVFLLSGIDSWLDSFHKISPRKDMTTHRQMLQKIMGSLCLMVLKVGETIVACGLAVADGDYVGLFDIVTAMEHRRQGYGHELTASLLAWGKSRGACRAYLQVMIDNRAAHHLYRKLGFQEIYHYWYRVPQDIWRST
jgi:ribosomal protein S18 acetylase RimI-like enzyme